VRNPGPGTCEMSERKAVTKATATPYRSASRAGKAKVLDESCELAGWRCDHGSQGATGGAPTVPSAGALERLYLFLQELRVPSTTVPRHPTRAQLPYPTVRFA